MVNWERIQQSIQHQINILHEELGWFNEEELQNTARRIKDFYKEWYSNYEFKFTLFDNEKDYDELVILKDIDFYSMCSHHMLPFYGKVHIAYLPSDKVCGVSKLARAVKKFASKPQIQEQLTQEIADFLNQQLQPKFLMVVVEAQHLCMLMRGVKQHNSKMITSAIRYKEEINPEPLKKEFLSLLKVKE